jgi:Tfp pilus assembly protein FimT
MARTLSHAARDVASALQFAKMKAISSRLEYNVVFNVTNKTYQLKRKDPSLGWTPEGNENSMPRGVAVDTNLANETCQFNPDGTCSNGTITINNQEGKTYKVVVCRTGRIKIQR